MESGSLILAEDGNGLAIDVIAIPVDYVLLETGDVLLTETSNKLGLE